MALTLCDSLARRGHRVDLLLEVPTCDYGTSVPERIGLFYRRIVGMDPQPPQGFDQCSQPLHPINVNLFSAMVTWIVLSRKHRHVGVRRRFAVFAKAIATYLRGERPDVVVSALHSANASCVYAMELVEHKPVLVLTVHSNVQCGYGNERLRTARDLYGRADAVVGVSEGVRSSIETHFPVPRDRTHTIYNPVPTEEIRWLANASVAHPWFLGQGPPVILSVGRESAAKDHKTLVEAFCLVRREAQARLAFIGSLSDQYCIGLVDRARQAMVDKDIAFLGFDENPYRFMRRAHVLVLSSRWEGLALVLVEAMACGTPVVSTDSPYGPREILDNGKWGRLVPVGSAQAMAEAIIGVLKGKKLPGSVLMERADAFSCVRASDAYLGLVRSLVAHGSGSLG